MEILRLVIFHDTVATCTKQLPVVSLQAEKLEGIQMQ